MAETRPPSSARLHLSSVTQRYNRYNELVEEHISPVFNAMTGRDRSRSSVLHARLLQEELTTIPPDSFSFSSPRPSLTSRSPSMTMTAQVLGQQIVRRPSQAGTLKLPLPVKPQTARSAARAKRRRQMQRAMAFEMEQRHRLLERVPSYFDLDEFLDAQLPPGGRYGSVSERGSVNSSPTAFQPMASIHDASRRYMRGMTPAQRLRVKVEYFERRPQSSPLGTLIKEGALDTSPISIVTRHKRDTLQRERHFIRDTTTPPPRPHLPPFAPSPLSVSAAESRASHSRGAHLRPSDATDWVAVNRCPMTINRSQLEQRRAATAAHGQEWRRRSLTARAMREQADMDQRARFVTKQQLRQTLRLRNSIARHWLASVAVAAFLASIQPTREGLGERPQEAETAMVEMEMDVGEDEEERATEDEEEEKEYLAAAAAAARAAAARAAAVYWTVFSGAKLLLRMRHSRADMLLASLRRADPLEPLRQRFLHGFRCVQRIRHACKSFLVYRREVKQHLLQRFWELETQVPPSKMQREMEAYLAEGRTPFFAFLDRFRVPPNLRRVYLIALIRKNTARWRDAHQRFKTALNQIMRELREWRAACNVLLSGTDLFRVAPPRRPAEPPQPALKQISMAFVQPLVLRHIKTQFASDSRESSPRRHTDLR